MCGYLSVRHSVTLVFSIEKSKRFFKFLSPSGSHTIVIFSHTELYFWQYSDGNPPNGSVVVWLMSVRHSSIFDADGRVVGLANRQKNGTLIQISQFSTTHGATSDRHFNCKHSQPIMFETRSSAVVAKLSQKQSVFAHPVYCHTDWCKNSRMV